jgi:hypothetical protein
MNDSVQSTPSQVNHHNWRTNEAFLEYLQFSYQPSQQTAEQCILLLPIAVAEERLLGPIKETMLNEAMAWWNEPLRFHQFVFSPSAKRWVYKGGTVASDLLGEAYPHLNFRIFGRLKAPQLVGTFCGEPATMMI